MLVIPVTSASDKKQLPRVTLLLIIVNCLIYFLIQSKDNKSMVDAYSFYDDSGLANIELTYYLHYLGPNNENASAELQDPEKRQELLTRMLQDDNFRYRLEKEQIILPGEPEYGKWREKRTEFEKLLNKSVANRYGYSPAKGNYFGLFSYMFLHGSVLHLVGNMVFLWLVGSLLELVINPFIFLAGYLVTGVLAATLFGLVYPLSAGPLIGASGAIAGLMGAYGLFFWRQRIRIFYSLGFYFDYARVPALVLFPFWLGNEIMQLILRPESHVAYMAHIGGLLSGGTLAVLHLVFLGNKSDELFKELFKEEEQKDRLEKLLQQGQEKMATLDFQGARKDMEKILAFEPDHPLAIRNLYTIDKTNPRSEYFHQSASKLLMLLMRGSDENFLNIFEEYKRLSTKPRITVNILSRLASIYIKQNRLKEAASCLNTLIKKAPNQPQIPGNLMRLAQIFLDSNQQSKANYCLKILSVKYGQSTEGIRAKEILGKSD